MYRNKFMKRRLMLLKKVFLEELPFVFLHAGKKKKPQGLGKIEKKGCTRQNFKLPYSRTLEKQVEDDILASLFDELAKFV